MSAHTLHPPILEGGVVDDCNDCKNKAEYPLMLLDSTNITMYVQRTIGWMRDDPSSFPRCATELKLMRNLEQIISDTRRLNERNLLDIVIKDQS